MNIYVIYVYKCVYMYICVYTYIHIYTFTKTLGDVFKY